MTLRAVVVGTGWAAEGHAKALQAAGVEVVAICGRSDERARSLAGRLQLDTQVMEWDRALRELKPDIVAVATPGGAHREIVEAAAKLGSNILCEKPLGINSAEARSMLAVANAAGVKHAYGATSCLEPVYRQLQQEIAKGIIGPIASIDVQTRMGLSPHLPFSWFHRLDQGGGMLNQIFTHVLEQVLFVTGGVPQAVTGEARTFIERAPVGDTIHDFRQWFSPVKDINENTEWRDADADTDYSAIVRLALPDGVITARFLGSLTSIGTSDSELSIYGRDATVSVVGSGNDKRLRLRERTSQGWRELSAPSPEERTWSPALSAEQNNWNVIFGRLVADIAGQPHAYYPTFEAGLTASILIDAIRAEGWTRT